MKRTLFILSFGVTLSLSTLNAGASGCGFHFWLGIPFLFGIGFGALCGYPSYTYAYPVYGYATYAPSTHVESPVQPLPSPAAAETQAVTPHLTQYWTPSTPGTGAWVPEPQPYSYTPPSVPKSTTLAQSPGAQTISITKSSDGVTIYLVK